MSMCSYPLHEDAALIITEKMSEWISVKDRLPKSDEQVLVAQYGSAVMGDTIGIDWYVHYAHNWAGRLHRDGTVTHWMPLPQPPKMKRKERNDERVD